MIIFVIAAFLAGWAIRSRVPVPSRVLVIADTWVLKIALPAMVVSKMARIDIGADLVVPIAAAWGAMGACAVLILALGRAMSWERSTTAALLLVAVLGNTSFLGLGMAEGLLGRDHLFAAVAYDQPGTFLALATWGAFVASHFGSGESGWRPVVRRLVTFAPFVALVVSVPVRAIDVPAWVWDLLDALARTVAPVAMASVGLRFVPWRRGARTSPVVAGLAVKMLGAPIVVAAVASAIGGWGDIAWQTAVLQASAPPMVSAGLVAINAGFDDETTTTLVGLGTLAGFAWMPLVSLAL